MLTSRMTRRQIVAASVVAAALGRTNLSVTRAADMTPVVGSFSIISDWVTMVGGEMVSVSSLVPAGGDAHTFDPAPSDVAVMTDARAIFSMGAGFEPWLADLVSASGTTAPVIAVNDSLELMPGSGEHEAEHDHDHEGDATPMADEHDHDHEAEAGHDHDHGAFDPHTWTDVQNAIISVQQIRDSLMEVDAANADTYTVNCDAYLKDLEELDSWIKSEVEKVPMENRKLVTTHDTLGYFAHAYGFEIIGTALGSLTTDVGDPSAGDIAALVDEIRGTGVPAIFPENVSNADLMQSIAKEAGVTVAPPLYSDALGESGSDGDSYLKMMRYNVTTIVTALTPQA